MLELVPLARATVTLTPPMLLPNTPSGMRVIFEFTDYCLEGERLRARQRGVELPLVISDHCDWSELVQTIGETGAEEIWVTHGREEALVHQASRMGRQARALALMGYEEEGE